MRPITDEIKDRLKVVEKNIDFLKAELNVMHKEGTMTHYNARLSGYIEEKAWLKSILRERQ